MHLLILLLTLFVDAPPTVLTGQIVIVDRSPVIRIDGKEIRLISNDEYLPLIMADERLASRTIRLEGQWKEKDRVFEVQHLHTVKQGKEFRVLYYCSVCDLWSFKPGPCVCCTKLLDLRELGEGEEPQ